MPFELDQICRQWVTQTADAIVYAEDLGLIRLWNSGAERIFGYSKDEAIGKSLDIIISGNQRKRHWDGIARTLNNGVRGAVPTACFRYRAIRKDGSRLSVGFTILPFHDEAGKTVGMPAFMRNVTSRFEEMKALRKLVPGEQ